MSHLKISQVLMPPLVLAVAIVLSGCGQDSPTSPDASSSNGGAHNSVALPADFFLNAIPAGAIPLTEARAMATAGDPVVFTGYIGGRIEPFTEDRAVFLVADQAQAPACSDHCSTPWDACCVPNDVIAANSATIQVVDEDGRMLRLNLKGRQGLTPGAVVTVVGMVREAGDAVFIVDASAVAIHEG